MAGRHYQRDPVEQARIFGEGGNQCAGSPRKTDGLPGVLLVGQRAHAMVEV
jgi:hypothetical protein